MAVLFWEKKNYQCQNNFVSLLKMSIQFVVEKDLFFSFSLLYYSLPGDIVTLYSFSC